MGITKQCRICKAAFTTRSNKSAVWEVKCHECYTNHKRTHVETRHREQITNNEASLRKDMKKLEAKVSDIDVLVSAEVSNQIINMSNLDIFEKINESVNQRIDSYIARVEEENLKFREKMQKHIVALNNKIVKIMKEMK
jgi:hypothetical protein